MISLNLNDCFCSRTFPFCIHVYQKYYNIFIYIPYLYNKQNSIATPSQPLSAPFHSLSLTRTYFVSIN